MTISLNVFRHLAFLWVWFAVLCCAPPSSGLECEKDHHCATGQRCQANRCIQPTAATIRLDRLVCDHFQAGQSVVCEIQGEGFLGSDKAWIGCLPFEPEDSKRLDDTRWQIRGRWLCVCGDQTIAANIRGNPRENLNSSRHIEGECGCHPDQCMARGVECGSFVDERQFTVECGPCPAYSTCEDGRCVGATRFSAQCQNGALHNIDGRGNDQGLRKSCAQGRCITRNPFLHDTCQEDLPPFSCTQNPDGTYCVGKNLITCLAGTQQSAQTCAGVCQPTPSPESSAQGKARCFARPLGYAMLLHKASGLCAVPAIPMLHDAYHAHLRLRPCEKENPSFYWKRQENGELRHASQLCAQVLWNDREYGRCSIIRLVACPTQPLRFEETWFYTANRVRIGNVLQMVPYNTQAPANTLLHMMPEKSITHPSQAEWIFVQSP